MNNIKKIIAFTFLICLTFQITGCKKEVPIVEITQQPTAIVTNTNKEVIEIPKEKALPVTLKNPDLPFKPIDYQANMPSYTVLPDLSNIENLSQFGDLTENQKNMLVKNSFFVTPSNAEQLFYVYEENNYKNIPSFITTDSVLQVYHIFYDYALRNTEQESLLTMTEQLTENMLIELLNQYKQVDDEQTKKAIEDCIAYFVVAQTLLEKPLPDGISTNAINLANEELVLIDSHEGFLESPIANVNVLYENFTVRGHYTRTDELRRYFLAMMWYGTLPVTLIKDGEIVNLENALKSVIITNALMTLPKETGSQIWENIYSPTVFFVGNADDFTPFEFWNIMIDIYDDIKIENLNDKDLLEEFVNGVKALEIEKAKNNVRKIGNSKNAVEFRFMGQRYIPDSDILQKLTKPIARPLPSGLDVAGVLGSKRAEEHISTYLNPVEKWPEYKATYDKVKTDFDNLPEHTWRSNMYYGWLWTLKPLLEERSEGFPQFMQTQAWQDKSLSTALGSWSELRHDTVLYGKQSAAEMGGGWSDSIGFVEPNIEVYERLLWLVNYSKENLESRNILSESLANKADEFGELLEFLINCSIKELNNEQLTEKELEDIITYGGKLESLSASIASSGEVSRWFEIQSETDRNMAVIVDVHNVLEEEMYYLEEAVGTASEIYVVVPDSSGKLFLTRGAVFDYFEFTNNAKLNDEQWQQLLKDDNAPERPKWTGSFIDTTGMGREIPYPEDNYN